MKQQRKARRIVKRAHSKKRAQRPAKKAHHLLARPSQSLLVTWRMVLAQWRKTWRLTSRQTYTLWRRWTRRSRHHLVYAVLIIAAFMLIWRGFWYLADSFPTLHNPIVSVGLGIGLILLLGARAKLFEF